MTTKLRKFNFFKTFSLMSLLTFFSRIFGYIRDLFFAFFLGASPLADSFLLAFRIPNFFRRLFAEGAINNAFIPIYLSISNKKNKLEAMRFSGSLLILLCIGLITILILGEIFMLDLVKLLAPSFSNSLQNKTAHLASIMFPYLLLISISSFLGAILNAKKRFLMWSFLPIILNLFMVLGMLVAFFNSLDVVSILAISVLFAGIFQFFLIFFWTRYLKITFIFKKPKISKEIKKFFKLLLPNLMAGGIVQINQLVGVIYASAMPGAISWLYYADRIVQLPLGIFIISISTILLTNLSSPKVIKNMNKVKKQIDRSLEIILGISFLSCIGLFIFSELITDILFKRGEFRYGDVKATSDAIFMYAIGLPAFGLIKVFSTIFFSKQDTKTPFKISFFSMILNIILIVSLVGKLGHLGIALALSLSSWANALTLYLLAHFKGYWKINLVFLKKIIKLFIVFFITLNFVGGVEHLVSFFDLISTATLSDKILYLVYLAIITITSFILFCIIFKIIAIKDLSKDNLFSILRSD
ncbi:MAG: murein biosynthesis integral membrane protein MurJ [Pseudomonadota bacterium]|nr:murein biosynthesis integral membrane protein MurJ [Pseudomonadota bacterium]